MAIDVWSTWGDRLAARALGAEQPVIELELESTLREMFENGRAWQERLGPYSLLPDESLLANTCKDSAQITEDECTGVYPDAYNAVIVDVRRVWVNGYELSPLDNTPARNYSLMPGTGPVGWLVREPGEIEFYPEITEAMPNAVYIRASLRPEACGDKVPDFMATHFFEAVLHGTLGRLYEYPGRPFSDAAKARYHTTKFRNELVRARDIADRKFSTADVPVQFPSFANDHSFVKRK